MKHKAILLQLTLISFFSLCWISIAWSQVRDPQITNRGRGQQSVVLGSTIQGLFRRFDPSFTVFTIEQFLNHIPDYFEGAQSEVPMAVMADFNGDGAVDIAFMGQSLIRNNEVSIKIVVALSTPNSAEKYQLYLVKEWKREDYLIPGSAQVVGPSGRVQNWGVYLSLATAAEIQMNRLNVAAALKLESDSSVFGFYTFRNNQKRFISGSEFRSEIKKNDRTPSQKTKSPGVPARAPKAVKSK